MIALPGFFSDSVLLQSAAPKYTTARCSLCELYKSCHTPKMPVYGEGHKGIMLVSSWPSEDDDEDGIPFSDGGGHVLKQHLKRLGLDLKRDCWSTYAAICHPTRKIKPELVLQYCQPNLLAAIKEQQPTVIVLLGWGACKGLLSELWSESVGQLATWVGFKIPSQQFNAWVCPLWHPNELGRFSNDQALALWFRRYFEEAVQLAEQRPWSQVPDYKQQIKLVLDPDKAALMLRKMRVKGGPICFDYETNCLKPDAAHAKIISCGVSWRGKITIAFPFVGSAVAELKDLLLSDCPKLGHNIKFEERWTRKVFGKPVRNWIWDSMQAAHILDNREGTTSLKFQSFVNFGFGKYNKHLESMMEAESGNALNRVQGIDLKDLLLYNGLDALLEYKLGTLQMEQLGYKEDDR